MITFSQKGDFTKSISFLNKAKNLHLNLDKYGVEGVSALKNATPIDSGETANSWTYKIITGGGKTTINWYNNNIVNGVNIAVILQYGHGTRNGGFVSGRDYINPVMRPLFDKIADSAWKEVSKL